MIEILRTFDELVLFLLHSTVFVASLMLNFQYFLVHFFFLLLARYLSCILLVYLDCVFRF